MTKNRLEAFSDGVLAIIITIMAMDIETPRHASWYSFLKIWPTLASYLISFAFVGVYWINHHHLIKSVEHVSSDILWTNLNLLFWISLIPFGNKWMGVTHFERFTVILYAIILLLCSLSFYFLQERITVHLKSNRRSLKDLIKSENKKTLISIVLVVVAIPAAFIDSIISLVLFALSIVMWIIPNKQIEREVTKIEKEE